VTHDDDVRLVNVLGAAALGLSDAMGVDAAAAAGIDATAATALVALLDLARGGSIRALSRLIGISHSGTVRLVDRMAEDGLISRVPGRDGRTVALTLTPRGRALASRIRAHRSAAIAAVLEGTTIAQRKQLASLCDIMIGNLVTARLSARREDRDPAGGALCRLCDPTACGRTVGTCPAASTAAAECF
jgi:MarR family transcriptional regulator, negative regulator of the multidrug operon emrRAB